MVLSRIFDRSDKRSHKMTDNNFTAAVLKAETEQKRGFWSRLFNRQKKDEVTVATITGSAMKTELTDSDIERLTTMSELEKAILRTVIPEAPHAIHSEILREAVAPLLTAHDRTGQRRELHERVEPLVEDGFIKYFCCMVDSYGLNPTYMGVADRLNEYVGCSIVDESSQATL